MTQTSHILTALRTELAAWEALLARLTTEQIHTPLTPSHWTVKDVVVHLRAWQQVTLARLEAARTGNEPVFPPMPPGLDLATENDVDTINAFTYERDKDMPWSEVYAAWHAGFTRVIALAEDLRDAEITDTQRYSWLHGYALLDVLEGTEAHHREDHRVPLEAWLRTHPNRVTTTP